MSAVAVVGVGLYALGFPNAKAWLTRQRDASEPPPTAALLDKHSRRRASPLTKALADVYAEALSEADLEASTVASVFGMALGEASTMIGLLDQMWKGDGSLSPMRFAASVHNAAAGVVSIGTKNTGLTTSMGADFDTPAMALCEAMAICASRHEPVIVACGDEAAPADLVIGAQGWDFLTCAVALVPSDRVGPQFPRLGIPTTSKSAAKLITPPDVSRGLAQNPQVGLLDLIDALRHGGAGDVRLDRGRGRGYHVEVTQP